MYRFKRGVKVNYARQGYIYFFSRRYAELTEPEQERVRQLCREAGGEYGKALLEFVTTDTSATALICKHHISKATLYRVVRRYYEHFFDGTGSAAGKK